MIDYKDTLIDTMFKMLSLEKLVEIKKPADLPILLLDRKFYNPAPYVARDKSKSQAEMI